MRIQPKTGTRLASQKPRREVKKYFYAIGIGDPGTGAEGGYYFTMDDLREIYLSSSIHGIQVWLEHGDASREVIGTVVYTWVDQTCGLMVVLRFDASTLQSQVILEWIKNKLFAGISLGYTADVVYENGLLNVVKKTIHELSIVRTPHHKSCRIQFVGNSIPLKSSRAVGKAPVISKSSALCAKDAICSDLGAFFEVLSGAVQVPTQTQ